MYPEVEALHRRQVTAKDGFGSVVPSIRENCFRYEDPVCHGRYGLACQYLFLQRRNSGPSIFRASIHDTAAEAISKGFRGGLEALPDSHQSRK